MGGKSISEIAETEQEPNCKKCPENMTCGGSLRFLANQRCRLALLKNLIALSDVVVNQVFHFSPGINSSKSWAAIVNSLLKVNGDTLKKGASDHACPSRPRQGTTRPANGRRSRFGSFQQATASCNFESPRAQVGGT